MAEFILNASPVLKRGDETFATSQKSRKEFIMKILLVFPRCPETFWSFKYALKFISKKASYLPLGLLTVAAMLPEEWDKKLIDMNVEPLTDKDLNWADYVFISATEIQRASVKKIIDRCKILSVKTVAGGPLFTTSAEEFDEVNYLVLNEAEITLPLFLEDIEKGRAKHIYTSSRWADIRKTPVPLWGLADMKKYASVNIQYSRGCPFNCEFCDIPMLCGPRPRTKDKEQVLAELESLYHHGANDVVFFVDDNFIGNKRKLKSEVLPAVVEWMRKRRHPFSLSTEASINLADDERLMELMVRAGFETVFVGIETPNEASLAECGKFQNQNRDLMASVKKIQDFGMEVRGGFIVGFDNDAPSIFEKLSEFIQDSGIVTAMVGLLNAPRGSRLYDRLIKEGRLLKDFSGNNTALSTNFIPKMGYQALIEGYKELVKTLYSPKHYYKRIMIFLRNYNPRRKKKMQFYFSDLGALFKSIWFLGITGKERIYYWKLMVWCCFRRLRLLRLAITYAIHGFHFRTIFENY